MITSINKTDPNTWPCTENLTDGQRTFIINEISLLPQTYPDIDFSKTIREGRHLTKCMWYRTLPNGEHIKRRWLIYSLPLNAIFCAYCKIFYGSSKAGRATSSLVTTGFTNWKKVSDKLIQHERSINHKECEIKWKSRFIAMKTCKGIDKELETSIQLEKRKWKEVLLAVIDAVMYLATNCLAFRGSDECIENILESKYSISRGNFLNLIVLLSKRNPTLSAVLANMKKGQTSYLSKTIQNEIIELLSKTCKQKILQEIKEARYFTIMFDCTPDTSHTEQMSEVIRYVKIELGECIIKETFIDFIEVEGKTGEYLTNIILEKLRSDGLDLQQCRGQSYDNGSNMAGIHKGVESRIVQQNELAEFVPCMAHSLNLVGMHAASACTEAVKLFGTVQSVFNFFVNSTTRWNLLKECTKTKLQGSSQTRWSAKYQAVAALTKNLTELAKILQKIEENGSAEAKFEARTLYNVISTFDFIVNLTVWNNILREINRVNNEIQKKDVLLSLSVNLMEGLIRSLNRMREMPFEFWKEEAKSLAEKMDIEPVLQAKRIPKRKRLFDELSEDQSRLLTSDQIFTKELNIIFDRLIAEITKRMTSANKLNSYFSFLNGHELSQLTSMDLKHCATNLALKYNRDLNAEDFCQELVVFKDQSPNLFKGANLKDASALNILQTIYANGLEDAFPNICIALRIYCTLPSTSASCERSFSKLKIIKNYLRSSMDQERLSGLALLSIENSFAQEINFEEVIESFAEKKARKVNF